MGALQLVRESPDAPQVLDSMTDDTYSMKELIAAIRAVESAVHALRTETADDTHSIDKRLGHVETIVGDVNSGLVSRTNRHSAQIDTLRTAVFTWLPVLVSSIALAVTLYSILRGR